MNKKKVTRIISPFALLIFPFLLAAISLILFKTDIITARSYAYPGSCTAGASTCIGLNPGDPCSMYGLNGTCSGNTTTSDCYCLVPPQQCVTRDEASCDDGSSVCVWENNHCRTTLNGCMAAYSMGGSGACDTVLDCVSSPGFCSPIDPNIILNPLTTDCTGISNAHCTVGFYAWCYWDPGYNDCLTACTAWSMNPVACLQHFDRCNYDLSTGLCNPN